MASSITRPRFRLSTLLWITLAVTCFFGGREYQRRESDQEWVRFRKQVVIEASRELELLEKALARERSTKKP